MNIVQVTTEIPPRGAGIRPKGDFHPDVLTVIKSMEDLTGDQILEVEWDDDKQAGVRASALKRGGFKVTLRKNKTFVAYDTSEDDDETDTAE